MLHMSGQQYKGIQQGKPRLNRLSLTWEELPKSVKLYSSNTQPAALTDGMPK